jgi:hypothetical protein
MRHGFRRGDGFERDGAGRRVEPANEVAVLDREPQGAVRIEHEGVRVARRRIRHAIFDDRAGRRIETADQSRAVSRVPDASHTVCDDPVRS